MARRVRAEGNDVSGSQGGAELLIQNGGFEGMRYAIEAEETLIGRNPTTDITLLDEGISREHALITYDAQEDRYAIEDLQSTNGIKVNGKRIRSAELGHGDELQIGNTLFRFLRGSEAG
jgi:pSer/pThr/pTyr-binding forkhead associated (FHA) protein